MSLKNTCQTGNDANWECHSPMDEPQMMDSFNGQNTFSEIKPRDIFRKGVIFDEHRHQVASRKKFHDKVEMGGILKGIIELDNPWRI